MLLCMAAGVAFDGHAAAATATPSDGSVLPFPPVPSASKAAPRLQDSVHKRRAEPQHLKPGAPNVLIILLDDVGFGQASTFGGEMNTPTLTRLASQGISYNTFHTTAICSPTRAALLTGRNHQRVGNGTIAERAVDWDGYTGVIPKTSATMAEVLRHYGYRTAAFGKWHNTPADQTTAMGPFDRWPTGHGFDYFYGFLAGETSQWEPRLVENTTAVEPPHDEKYHLTEDMAARGIDWLRKHRSFAPDKPFFMYWAPGAAHGPHQVGKEWSDKYKGKFDDGWDAYRERVFARQKQLGWIPADTKLTPRAANMPSWDSIPEAQRPFQRRLMEIYAGFVEHVDTQAGKLIDELDRLGHTRQHDRDLHLRRQRRQRRRPERHDQRAAGAERHPQHGRAADRGAGQDSAASTRWAVPRPTACTTPAGRGPATRRSTTPSSSRRTSAARATRWSSRGRRASRPTGRRARSSTTSTTSRRPSTKSLGIKPPKVVDGFVQDPMDGVSLAYTFADAKAPGAQEGPVLRQQRQPCASTRTAGWRRRSVR